MKTITLKADKRLDALLSRLASEQGCTRSAIIREAILSYEATLEKKALKVQMTKASYLVRDQAVDVAADLEDSLSDGI